LLARDLDRRRAPAKADPHPEPLVEGEPDRDGVGLAVVELPAAEVVEHRRVLRRVGIA
jgi:hypothetical protein